jgi:phage shock protein E
MRRIIDVREPLEFRQGHVEGAVNLPLSGLALGKFGDIDKDDEIILYCRSGHRAGVALQIFKQHGFNHVINGINPGHVEANHN